MNRRTLEILMRVRRMNRADIARLAGVSRQAVTLWFGKTGEEEIPMRARHQNTLARALDVPVDTLIRPLPIYKEGKEREAEAALLWDRLYASLTDFVAALLRGEPPALARLVQVYGLFKAARIVGKTVWRKFPEFSRFLEPHQREAWKKSHMDINSKVN